MFEEKRSIIKDNFPSVLQQWAESQGATCPADDDKTVKDENLKVFLNDGESLIDAQKSKSSFRNVEQNWFVPEPEVKQREVESKDKQETKIEAEESETKPDIAGDNDNKEKPEVSSINSGEEATLKATETLLTKVIKQSQAFYSLYCSVPTMHCY